MSRTGRFVTGLSTLVLALLVSGTFPHAAAQQPSGRQGQPAPTQPQRGQPVPETQTQPPLPPLPGPSKDKPVAGVPRPIYPTTPPEDKKFTFEKIFNYRVMKYSPPVVIQRMTRDTASNATPEQALAAQVSAMLAGDYDWWLSSWDAASQKFHRERDLQMKRAPADWRILWDRVLRGQQVRLVERAVTGPLGPYVMLLYELHDADGKVTLKSTFVSREEAGRWVATLDLSEDPFFQHYQLGKDKVSIEER
jgi:hypothetical protein